MVYVFAAFFIGTIYLLLCKEDIINVSSLLSYITPGTKLYPPSPIEEMEVFGSF